MSTNDHPASADWRHASRYPTEPPPDGCSWVWSWKASTGPEQRPGWRWEAVDVPLADLVHQLNLPNHGGLPLVPTAGCCAGHKPGELPHVLLQDGRALVLLPSLERLDEAQALLARRDIKPANPPSPNRGADDRTKPPPGYAVHYGDASGRWFAESRGLGAFPTREQAVANTWAHHDRITAPSEARALAHIKAADELVDRLGAAKAEAERDATEAKARAREAEQDCDELRSMLPAIDAAREAGREEHGREVESGLVMLGMRPGSTTPLDLVAAVGRALGTKRARGRWEEQADVVAWLERNRAASAADAIGAILAGDHETHGGDTATPAPSPKSTEPATTKRAMHHCRGCDAMTYGEDPADGEPRCPRHGGVEPTTAAPMGGTPESLRCPECQSTDIDNVGDGARALCMACSHEWTPGTCDECDGRGRLMLDDAPEDDTDDDGLVPCPWCDGSGRSKPTPEPPAAPTEPESPLVQGCRARTSLRWVRQYIEGLTADDTWATTALEHLATVEHALATPAAAPTSSAPQGPSMAVLRELAAEFYSAGDEWAGVRLETVAGLTSDPASAPQTDDDGHATMECAGEPGCGQSRHVSAWMCLTCEAHRYPYQAPREQWLRGRSEPSAPQGGPAGPTPLGEMVWLGDGEVRMGLPADDKHGPAYTVLLSKTTLPLVRQVLAASPPQGGPALSLSWARDLLRRCAVAENRIREEFAPEEGRHPEDAGAWPADECERWLEGWAIGNLSARRSALRAHRDRTRHMRGQPGPDVVVAPPLPPLPEEVVQARVAAVLGRRMVRVEPQHPPEVQAAQAQVHRDDQAQAAPYQPRVGPPRHARHPKAYHWAACGPALCDDVRPASTPEGITCDACVLALATEVRPTTDEPGSGGAS